MATIQSAEPPVSTVPDAGRRRARRRRGAVALASLSLSLLATSGYWLAATGVETTSIIPAPGSPVSGNYADLTAMSPTVTSGNGEAQLQSGVALEQIVLSSAVTGHTNVNIAWTNATYVEQILHSPWAQISLGLYYSVHSGVCNYPHDQSEDSPLVNLTDPNGQPYCAALDQSATGPSVSESGKLLLARNQVVGSMQMNMPTGSISACSSSTSNPDTLTWCQPSSDTSNMNQRVLWVIATVTVPGDNNSGNDNGLPGQQSVVSALNFYFSVSAY